MTLDQLIPGQRAIITGFNGRGTLIQRVMTLGLIEGTGVEMVRRAPTGDPLEIRVLTYQLSLRKSEACLVQVVPEG